MNVRDAQVKHRDRTIRGFLSVLGSPRALTVWLLYKHGEHKQLLDLVCNPLDYQDPEAFRADYAATKLLSKCADLQSGIDTKQVAIESAMMAEEQCRKTNTRLLELRRDHVSGRCGRPEFLQAAFIIDDILGPCPDDIVALDKVGWSPGRTSSCFGDALSSSHKYAGSPDVTVGALGMARNLLCAAPNWGAAALDADGPCSILLRGFNVVRGNTLTVVPKNAKTDRTICYEPHMNIRVQLAIGSYIRGRLAKSGVNLNDQSINARRAQVASRFGHLCTIDLSSASDTISVELVRELLPPDWFALLNKARSHETLWPDGEWRVNQKFSSMGNGFTFELESLIFFALCSAVTRGVSVYGDDIVAPTAAFHSIRDVLEYAGFTLNVRKSFWEGWFRESCGSDVFRGLDCTPVYVRSLSGDLDWFIKIHNALRRFFSVIPRVSYNAFLRWIRTIVPYHLGPQGFGDGHYHVNLDEACPSRHRTWDGWLFFSAIKVMRVNRDYGDRVFGRYSGRLGYGALCTAVGPRRPLSVYDTGVDRRYSVLRVKRVFSPRWEDVIWIE